MVFLYIPSRRLDPEEIYEHKMLDMSPWDKWDPFKEGGNLSYLSLDYLDIYDIAIF